MIRLFAIFIGLGLILPSCATVPKPEPYRPVFNAIAFEQAVEGIRTAADVRKLVSNRTMHSVSRGHGNQFEYLASNGRTFLWYPGNRRIVAGEWKADIGNVNTFINQDPFAEPKVEIKPRICFRYGANSYNPVTKTVGGRWECRHIAIWMKSTHDLRSGDPLNLSNNLPYILAKFPVTTIKEVATKIEASDPIGPNLATWRDLNR
ncbi:MAG: hypothetical protein ACPG5U_02655 [Planktomarina sp.]